MLRDLKYQSKVLTLFNTYVAELAAQKRNADAVRAVAEQNPGLRIPIPDHAEIAWDNMLTRGLLPLSRIDKAFSPRFDPLGRAVPNVVFKVPTAGGKTFLATSALSQIFSGYLGSNTGFVLWVVPSEAIYSQTLDNFRDRQHPYRQILDQAAAGRVLLLEKDTPFSKSDVEQNLCVMLLMLQSANRRSKESLKIFQDRGDVHGFFPSEGDQDLHQALLDKIPNLEAYPTNNSGSFWPLVKDSLGNVLRLIRPVIILDEGHKATSPLAVETLYGFNPSFVLELTATPRDRAAIAARNGSPGLPARNANVLVEILGRELDSEGMIKMPLNLEPRQGPDWRSTLTAAVQRLDAIQKKANKYHSDGGQYIRPILLVQVERTGKEQREAGFIHADDAKDWLKQSGLNEDEIAIKTAQTNELSAPENKNLLSPTNHIRAIITKQALQEGWDCSFAYVLCSLSASSNINAMTQLVGRILRQPGAERTGVADLDQCYVITHHAQTADVISAIKTGLESEGLADLALSVRVAGEPTKGRKINRRDKFKATDIYLPLVLRVEPGAAPRPLDYEMDILFNISWTDLDVTAVADGIPDNAQAPDRQMRVFRPGVSGRSIDVFAALQTAESVRFDPVFATRQIADLIANPWVGREVVGSLIQRLRARGFSEDRVGELNGLIIEDLRRFLSKERDARAEEFFRDEVAAGRIQFRLRVDGTNWKMPHTMATSEPDNSRQLARADGSPLETSLFSPLYERDFNSDERDVAVYLDGDNAIQWWHRNVARSQYGIQGWKKQKLYPDFVFAVQRSSGSSRVSVIEMKGDQLDNLDTDYKRKVLRLLSGSFSVDKTQAVGTLQISTLSKETVECDLILFSEWRSKLPQYLSQ